MTDSNSAESGAPSPTTRIDRNGDTWTAFSGIWYRREPSGGYGECRGTLTMLERDFGPTTPISPAKTIPVSDSTPEAGMPP